MMTMSALHCAADGTSRNWLGTLTAETLITQVVNFVKGKTNERTHCNAFDTGLRCTDRRFDWMGDVRMNNGDMPAMPVADEYQDCCGLTKREMFAMAAMQGMLSGHTMVSDDALAVHSVKIANALLAEMERTK
jgi:hypothetical protein